MTKRKGEKASMKQWAKAVTKGQKESAVFLSIWSDKMREDPSGDMIPIFQIGYAMVLDKPIIIVAPQGANIPENLRRAAHSVQFFDPDVPGSVESAGERAFRSVQHLFPGLEEKLN